MSEKALVVGVGIIPFAKPGASESYEVMGAKAAHAALADASISYDKVQQAYVGYVFGDSTCGQAALYPLGLTGIPIVNVNNNCSTGSTALFLARQAVESGAVSCALALGFEQMQPGAILSVYQDRKSPIDMVSTLMARAQQPDPNAPYTAQLFGGAGREYADTHGTKMETFAKISVKARRHAFHNPHAIFRTPLSVDEVLASKHMYGPLTRYQCCPPTCGAAAAIIASSTFARTHGLKGVEIVAQSMVTDINKSFARDSMIDVVGYWMARNAADAVYEAAGVAPTEVDVVELHDCFTVNELLTYEAIRLTPEGTAEKFIWDNENTYGGRVVTNPSGGLLSKGHPLGATGLAQCAELVWQLRGDAGGRQVSGARTALQHNLGLGGACVVTLYRRE